MTAAEQERIVPQGLLLDVVGEVCQRGAEPAPSRTAAGSASRRCPPLTHELARLKGQLGR